MNSEALGRQIRVIAFIMIVFMLEMNTSVTLHAERNTGIKDMVSFLDGIREAVFVVGIVDPTTHGRIRKGCVDSISGNTYSRIKDYWTKQVYTFPVLRGEKHPRRTRFCCTARAESVQERR